MVLSKFEMTFQWKNVKQMHMLDRLSVYHDAKQSTCFHIVLCQNIFLVGGQGLFSLFFLFLILYKFIIKLQWIIATGSNYFTYTASWDQIHWQGTRQVVPYGNLSPIDDRPLLGRPLGMATFHTWQAPIAKLQMLKIEQKYNDALCKIQIFRGRVYCHMGRIPTLIERQLLIFIKPNSWLIVYQHINIPWHARQVGFPLDLLGGARH